MLTIVFKKKMCIMFAKFGTLSDMVQYAGIDYSTAYYIDLPMLHPEIINSYS